MNNNPIIESRRALIDGLNAKRNFRERFAAAEFGRKRLSASGPAINIGNEQDVVYYDALSFVSGYAATYFDPNLVTARFDTQGVAVATRIREDIETDRIESASGAALAYVRPLRNEPGVLVLGSDGGLLGSVILRNGHRADGLDPEGNLAVQGVYGPDRVVWLGPFGHTLSWAKSRLMSGAWLATEDAWHLFVPGWRSAVRL